MPPGSGRCSQTLRKLGIVLQTGELQLVRLHHTTASTAETIPIWIQYRLAKNFSFSAELGFWTGGTGTAGAEDISLFLQPRHKTSHVLPEASFSRV